MRQPALLTLVQWLSPAFPTGAFAYSHGLEHAVAIGTVQDAATLEGWLRGVLVHGAGWQDSVLLACALAPGADHGALDAQAGALQASAERARETREQGAAFARTVAALGGRDLPPRALPVALGEAAGPLALDPKDVIALYLQGFVGNLVVIAVRHVPLGQTEGQAVLARLSPLIAELAGQASRAGLEDIATATLAADLSAMLHETMDVRIFRT